MSDYAINPYAAGMDSTLLQNPYFLKSLQYTPQADSTAITQQTPVVVADSTSCPTFQGNASTAIKKSSNAGAYLLGTLGVGAIGGCAYILSKGKTGKGFLNQFKTGWNKVFQKTAKQKTIGFTTINGKKVFYLPGQRGQALRASNANFADELDKLGISRTIPNLADDAVKVTGFNAKITHGGNDNIIWVRNGKVVKVLNKDNHNITSVYKTPSSDADKDFVKEINDYVKKVLEKDRSSMNSATGIRLQQVTDGVTYGYRMNNGTSPIELNKVITSRYHQDSPLVQRFLLDHKDDEIGGIVQRFINKGETNGMNIGLAEIHEGGKKFRVVDGQITEAWDEGLKKWVNSSSAEFAAIYNPNATAVEKALKNHDFHNITYTYNL